MIKTILAYFFGFLASVFVYMVLGATILEIFLILLRKLKNNAFVKFFIDKFLVEKDIENPNFEMVLWCTIFWPILILIYIITIPTIGFTYIIEKMFKKVDKKTTKTKDENKE